MKTRAFLIGLLSLLTGSLPAQNRIFSGQVIAAGGGVPGASVVVSDGTGTATLYDGTFELTDLPAEKITIRVSSVGYKPVKRQVDLSHKDITGYEFILEESTLGMDELVVTGTMQPTFVTQSPIQVEVVTAEHMNTFMPAAASSIVEGISLVNGVQEVVSCGVCFTSSISINGLPGPYTAILMDGAPIYGNLASVYGLNGIPAMLIDRFEVIKGPSSTLYGSEAVAGVINIITKDPEEQPLLSADVMGTTHGEVFGNLSLSPTIGKSSGFIGANYAYRNNFEDQNGDGFGDLINMDRVSLFTKWDIHRKSGKKFTLSGKYYYEDRRNGVKEYLENRNYRNLRGSKQIYGESIFTHRFELFGTYEMLNNLKLDYSLSSHEQDSYYGADFYQANQRIVFGNFVWNQELGKHQLLGGLTTRYQYYDDNTVATEAMVAGQIENLADAQFIPGIFLQDEWKITNQFTLLAGGRLDHYQRHGFIVAPRLNAKYNPGTWTTLRANFGTGFRIVNLFTEDHAFITGQREVVITEELQPEESYNASLNLNHVYSLPFGQGTLNVDAFYTYFTNKIIPDYEVADQIIYANTNGYAISRGMGINLNHEFLIPLSINLGFNYQDVTETEPDENGVNQTRNIEFAPHWTGIANARYQLKEQAISFAYSARFTGPMRLPEVYDLNSSGNPVSVPRPTVSSAFSMHDIQVTKSFGNQLSVYGGVQNIFNYIQPWSPLVGFNDPTSPPGFSEQFDTAYAYAPVHGRELFLGLRWKVGK